MYSIGEFAEKIGVTIQTLRNWHKDEKLIPEYISEGGTRYYSEKQLNSYLNQKFGKKPKQFTIGYCKLDGVKKKDIEEIKDYMIKKGCQLKVFKISEQDYLEEVEDGK